jgi:replicative DNA helicase
MGLAPLLDLRPAPDPALDWRRASGTLDSGAPAPVDIPHVPANIEAEQALLGILLYDNAAFERVEDLAGEHFYEHFHGRLFDAIADAVRRNVLAEPILLAERFKDDPAYIELGSVRYLANLVDVAPPSSNAADYARAIRETHRRREILNVAYDMALAAKSGATESIEIIEAAERQLFDLTETRAKTSGFSALAGSLHAAMSSAKAAYERGGGITGITTGLIDLDRKLGGLHDSDLIIIASRPSMGKTSLGLNIADAAAKSGRDVGFNSLEMSDEQLALRLLAEKASIPSDVIRRGALQGRDFYRLEEAAERLETLRIHIDPTGAIPISKIAARARRLKRTKGLDLLIVDYLQLATNGGKPENRVQEVSAISAGLKAIAKDLSIPVVALAQLSRQVESRDDKRPNLADLRDSGSIEQDADVVIFIYREAYYLARSEPAEGTEKHVDWQEKMERCRNVADLIIAKQRHGPIGTVKVSFDEALTKFGNLARDDPHPPYNPGAGG